MAPLPISRPVIIAIDGPAASGKGTLAERLAAHFGYAHLETGRLYRAVAAKLLAGNLTAPSEAQAADAAQHLGDSDLNSPHLYEEATGLMASKVSALGPVRAALLAFQHEFAGKPPGGKPGAVIDGRDIGTVVCPGADHKFFVTAAPEIRAKRRVGQLQSRGVGAIYAAVLRDILERDALDTQRTNSPLRPSPDAHMLDTSDMTAEQVFAAALSIISSSR